MMFQKKRFFENKKKSQSDFELWTPPAKPAKQKKFVAIENLFRLHTRGSPVASAEVV